MEWASPDQLVTAGAHVSREWGSYGYRVCVEASGSRGAVFLGRAADGGEFRFWVDRWCNIIDIPEEHSHTLEAAIAWVLPKAKELSAL